MSCIESSSLTGQCDLPGTGTPGPSGSLLYIQNSGPTPDLNLGMVHMQFKVCTALHKYGSKAGVLILGQALVFLLECL